MEGNAYAAFTSSFISSFFSFPLSHTLTMFFLCIVILLITIAPLLCLYDYCKVKTWVYKSLVTEISIFKRCVLSWCFHLHSQNEERYILMMETFKWQWVNCVWVQLVTLNPSAPVSEVLFGLQFFHRSPSCLQLMLHWLELFLSQYFALLVRSSRCCLTYKTGRFFYPCALF